MAMKVKPPVEELPVKIRVFALFQLGKGVTGKIFSEEKDQLFILEDNSSEKMIAELVQLIEEKYLKEVRHYGEVHILHYQVLGYVE